MKNEKQSLRQIIDDGEQKMMDKIFNKKQSERVEVELRSEFEGDITIKRLTNVQIDYLPFSPFTTHTDDDGYPAEKDGVITNYLVKRIFRDFCLILELWRVSTDLSDPLNKKVESTLLVDSIINEVPGQVSHPSFADYRFDDGKLYWFKIDQNWLEDTHSLKYCQYDIQEKKTYTYCNEEL